MVKGPKESFQAGVANATLTDLHNVLVLEL